MSYRYPLATTTWDEHEYQALQRIIDSGNFTMGNNVAEFEREFAKYLGRRYAVMVNSGSSANLLMTGALFYTSCKGLRLNRGDEVIVPAVSWSTTYFPLYQYGLSMKFVDIDMHTLNFDIEQLRKAITPKTRAIMAVNLLGNPNNFSVINEIIGDRNIILLEDNCESLGAEFAGKKTGTFGVVSSFSFFYSHHISTMEGGAVTTDDEELYQIMLSMRAHGWTRNLPKENLICNPKSDDSFNESFRFVLPGYNLRPLEMSGGVGLEQIKKLPHLISARRENAELFQRVLANHPNLLVQSEIGRSSWFGFSLVIRPESNWSRKYLLGKLEDLGFECRPIVAGNFTKNEAVKYFNSEIFGELKNANHIDQGGVFIGNHHYPIIEAINSLGDL